MNVFALCRLSVLLNFAGPRNAPPYCVCAMVSVGVAGRQIVFNWVDDDAGGGLYEFVGVETTVYSSSDVSNVLFAELFR